MNFKTNPIVSVALLAVFIGSLVIAACGPASPPAANELESA